MDTPDRTPDFLSLAGSIPVPAAKRNVPWDEILHQAYAASVRRLWDRPGADHLDESG